MEKELRFEEVPQWWAICQDHDCPLAATCLRHHAATIAPITAEAHLCIIPHHTDGDRCPHFVENRTVRLACGFASIFTHVSNTHFKAMKRAIMGYLGTETSKGTYYRYMHGERLLSPEQQAWFSRLMKRYGYSPEITFDNYIDDFIFKSGK